MTREELIQFCEKDLTQLAAPWSRADFTYASNGHLLIRIPRIYSVPENEKAPDAEKMLLRTPEPPEWLPIPEVSPEEKACNKCQGTGKNGACPECKGKGYVEFENRYNEYQCDCETCEGESTVPECLYCLGTGKLYPHKTVKVGISSFSDQYLKLLSTLPNCEIGPNEMPKAAKFRFQGGEGLLMPRAFEYVA